ncbi:hypothetical protein ACFSCX_05805 [Bacillus salitolerans]|uniref:DUF3267 domain-containing protein n=1 Tax=Bacillus salitolerans TaxID=1437434 RepID=A0ABW4LPP9_9BACI
MNVENSNFIRSPRLIDNNYFQASFFIALILFLILNWTLVMESFLLQTNVLLIQTVWFLLLLKTGTYVHEYSHYFAARFIFNIKTFVSIKKRRCIPLKALTPNQFLIIVIFPSVVQGIIWITCYLLFEDSFIYLSCLFVYYFVGSLSDICLFFKALPLVNKNVLLRYKASGTFQVKQLY